MLILLFSVLGEATTPEQGAWVTAAITAAVCLYTAQQTLELWPQIPAIWILKARQLLVGWIRVKAGTAIRTTNKNQKIQCYVL